MERTNSLEYSARKKKNNKENQHAQEDDSGNTELWFKVIGRKERKQNKNKKERHRIEKRADPKVKKRRLLKTSAVVITVGDQKTSYSEILTWARSSVKLSDEEMKMLSTKRSATGGILLKIKGENNKETAEKLTNSLRAAFKKYPSVKVHIPKQMAEMTLVGLDISISKEEIR